jgi:hypothetical protein
MSQSHLGHRNTKRNDPIFVALPMVAKTSWGGVIAAQTHECFLPKNYYL